MTARIGRKERQPTRECPLQPLPFIHIVQCKQHFAHVSVVLRKAPIDIGFRNRVLMHIKQMVHKFVKVSTTYLSFVQRRQSGRPVAGNKQPTSLSATSSLKHPSIPQAELFEAIDNYLRIVSPRVCSALVGFPMPRCNPHYASTRPCDPWGE